MKKQSNYKSIYSALSDPHDQEILANNVPKRFTIYQCNPDNLIEDLKLPCMTRFYDQSSFNIIADSLTETHVPIFVLGSPRSESDRLMNIYFTCDDTKEEAQSAFMTMIKLVDHYQEVRDGTKSD